MQPKPWLKLWVEWVHDPKTVNLSLAEKGSWCLILSLAQQCAADGYIIKGNGAGMSVAEIASCLHITSVHEYHTFQKTIRKMEGMGSLAWEDGRLLVKKFKKRQEMTPSETPEAVAERVRRYRYRKGEVKSDVTEKSLQSTPLIEGNNKDIYKERETVTARNTLQKSEKTGKPRPDVTEKSLHQFVFSHWWALQVVQHKAMTPKMETALRSALKTYSVEEICQAMSNYAEILHGPQYRWSYRWTMQDFLNRGLEKFMDIGVARTNYLEEGARHERKTEGAGPYRGDPRRTKAPTHEEYLRSLPNQTGRRDI